MDGKVYVCVGEGWGEGERGGRILARYMFV